MNINFDIDEKLLAGLDESASIKKWSRETAIKYAIEEWVSYQPKRAAVREMLKNWEGDPDFPPFELDRPGPESLPPDPFAERFGV